MLIEICCGKDSRIGHKTRYSKICLVIRITIDDDFSKRVGVDKVIQALEQYSGYPILIWVSIPCTGGTQWTYYNWAHGGASTRALIQSHVEKFHRLLGSLEAIMPSVRRFGGQDCHGVAEGLQVLEVS